MLQVKEMVRTEELKGMIGRVGGEAKQRKVWEVLDSPAGPPPLPLKSAYSSRSPSSRQVHYPAASKLLWSCDIPWWLFHGLWIPKCPSTCALFALMRLFCSIYPWCVSSF